MFGPVEFIHRTPPKYKGQIFPHLISFLPNLPHTFGERIVGQHHATRPVSWQSLAGGLIPSSVPLTIPKSHLYVVTRNRESGRLEPPDAWHPPVEEQPKG